VDYSVGRCPGSGDNSGGDYCLGVATDTSGNVYCAGYTGGALGEAHGGGTRERVRHSSPKTAIRLPQPT
jgi:hypothetical protein